MKTVGYYEDFLEQRGDAFRLLGVRRFPAELPPGQAGRPLGHGGTRELELVEPVELTKGAGGKATVAASPARPRRVRTILWPIQART